MSQQPATPSPSNYWTWQVEPTDIEADAARQPAQSDQRYAADPTATVAAQEQPSGQARAWQVPHLVAQGKHAGAAAPVRAMPKVRRPSPVRMLLLLALVVLLGVAGSASGFGLSVLSRHHRQATVPSPVATSGRPPRAAPTPTPRRSPSPTPTQPQQPSPTPTSMPSPTAVPQPVILAQDTFARPDQQFWGRASDGSTWGGDANSAQVFAIVGGTGQLRDGQGFFNAILGPQVANEEVFYRGSVSHFDQLRDNLGAVLRWTDNEHYYKAYLDGTSLILIKRVNGVVTRLGAVPFAAQDGVSYALRFRAVGPQLFVRAWPSAGPEPGGWMITARDEALSSGFGGLRVLLENDITVTVTLFQERSIA